MKRIAIIGIPLLAFGCGTADSNHRQKAGYALTQKAATLVNSIDELPRCSPERSNKLIYIKDIDSFKICSNGLWSSVDSADQGAEGRQAVAMKKISGSEFDLCSDSAEMLCYLQGGEFITYADGSKRYTVRVAKKSAALSSSPDDNTLSSDISSSSMDHQKSWENSQVLILPDVTRNSVTSGVWLRFDALAEQFTLYFDANQDKTVSEGDEVLFQADLTNF